MTHEDCIRASCRHVSGVQSQELTPSLPHKREKNRKLSARDVITGPADGPPQGNPFSFPSTLLFPARGLIIQQLIDMVLNEESP